MAKPNLTIPNLTAEQITRFYSCFTQGSSDECWEWEARIGNGGYGTFSANRRNFRAHRLMCFFITGMWNELFVLHKCDNPPCVNPNHLVLGTALDNMRDMEAKGRHYRPGPTNPSAGANHHFNLHPERVPRGSRNGNSRLTEDAVRAIKQGIRDGVGGATLSRLHNVSKSAISYIRRGRTWAHIR